VTGPFAAGKTTFIRTISEITVLATERPVTDSTRVRKAATTVAMDHGRITIGSDLALYLFGTPGQDRFDFMWDVLSEGMLGWVLLLDGTLPLEEAAANARVVHDAFRRLGPDRLYVVGVNRRESLTAADIEVVRAGLGLELMVPVLPLDTTSRASIKVVLLSLLEAVRVDRRQLVAAGA
jgi:signal recognition particle receptor subunit beta